MIDQCSVDKSGSSIMVGPSNELSSIEIERHYNFDFED